MSNEQIIQNGLIVGRAAGPGIAVVPNVDGISTISFDDRSGGQISSISFNHSTNTLATVIGPTTQFQVTSGSVIIAGDLIVNGTTTTIGAADLAVVDNIFLLNKGEAGAGVGNGTGSSGIEIERGTSSNVSWEFNESNDWWNPTGTIQAIGNIATIDSTDATEQVLTVTSTGAIKVPSGTAAQQPATPSVGMVRYDTSFSRLETYGGSEWGDITGTSITSIQQGYIDGLILSNNAVDSAKDIDISRGLAVDDTNAINIVLPENLLTRTEEFDHTDWSKLNLTISADAIVAPNGTTTADKLVETAVDANHRITRNDACLPSTQYTMSFYIKAGERQYGRLRLGTDVGFLSSVKFDLGAGVITDSTGTDAATIEDVGNGWYRLTHTDTTQAGVTSWSGAGIFVWDLITGGSSGGDTYLGDITKGFYVWGAQVERSSSPSDYTKRITTANFTKQLDAVWAVGTEAGGLDSGTVAADTWYHVWAIRRSDTGVVDVLFSTKGKLPIMPTNYDQKRRIGAILTDASANIIAFHQYGDYFYWDTLSLDFTQSTTSTSAVLKTMSVPIGLQVTGLFHFGLNNNGSGNNEYILITSPDQADLAATTTFYTIVNSGNDTSDAIFISLRTSINGQIRVRAQNGGGSRTFQGMTYGWIDHRITATYEYSNTDWVFVGTGADDASIGTVTWATPGNITADDGSYATASTSSDATTHYIKGTNLGLSVPTDATIDGIEVRFEAKYAATLGSATLDNLRIVKGGTIGSTERSDSAAWTTSDVVYTYGGLSDLWGETWTASDVNASNFGFVFSANLARSFGSVVGSVDYMQVKVYYREE